MGKGCSAFCTTLPSILYKSLYALKTLLSLIFVLFKIACLYSQDMIDLHIVGKINSQSLDQITLKKCGLKGSPLINIGSKFELNKPNKFIAKVSVPKGSFFLLLDGYDGHKLFFDHSDTIYIEIVQKTKNNALTGTFNKMNVKAKYYGNYKFFDDVSSFFGGNRLYLSGKFDANKFKLKCDSAYIAALAILANYQKRGIVTDNFIKYARAELFSMYIYKLFDPLAIHKKEKLPKDFFKIVKEHADFNSVDFAENAPTYADAGYLFNMYYLNTFNTDEWYSNFNEEFASANTYFKGIMRDMILGWCIMDYKDKDFTTFDSLYNAFLNTCSNTAIKEMVINNVEQYLLEEKLKPSLIQVLENTKLITTSGDITSLKNINSSKSLLLFDIWASWCLPCKKQMPYSLKFEKRFFKDVDFVYISIDKDRRSWIKAVNKLGLQYSRNYLLMEGDKSMMGRYFDINSVPRYILLNVRDNIVVHKNLPLPELKGFAQIIENSLNNF